MLCGRKMYQQPQANTFLHTPTTAQAKISINFHSHMHEKEISVSHKRASWRRHVEKKLRRDEGHCTNIILHSLCVLAYLETSVSAWRKTRGEIPLTYEWMTQRGPWHTAESFSMFYITAPDSRLASGIQSPSLTQLKSLINFMKSKKQKQSLGIDAGWKVFVLQCCFETKERKPIGISCRLAVFAWIHQLYIYNECVSKGKLTNKFHTIHFSILFKTSSGLLIPFDMEILSIRFLPKRIVTSVLRFEKNIKQGSFLLVKHCVVFLWVSPLTVEFLTCSRPSTMNPYWRFDIHVAMALKRFLLIYTTFLNFSTTWYCTFLFETTLEEENQRSTRLYREYGAGISVKTTSD